MAYKPQVGPQMAAPNVIPMADIMLVLLIIFMVVTPMLQKTHQVDLAPTDNPRDMQDADKDDAIIVAVTREKNIPGQHADAEGRSDGPDQGSSFQPPGQNRLCQERFARHVWRRCRRRRRDSLRRCRSARSAHREEPERKGSSSSAACGLRTVVPVDPHSNGFPGVKLFGPFVC